MRLGIIGLERQRLLDKRQALGEAALLEMADAEQMQRPGVARHTRQDVGIERRRFGHAASAMRLRRAVEIGRERLRRGSRQIGRLHRQEARIAPMRL